MRVVLLRSNPVSPEPPVEKVADTLLAHGHDVTVIGWERYAGSTEDYEALELQHGIARIVRLSIPAIYGGGIRKNLLPLLKFQIKLFRWLKVHRKEYDSIHAFDFDTGLTACQVAGRWKKKLVYHILDFYVDTHGFSESWLKKSIRNLEHKVINHADCTIICSDKRKEQIKGSYPKKLEVIHNTPISSTMDSEKFIFDSQNRKCRIVFVGILAPFKFLEEIIEFVKNDARFEFHIGGFGILENMVKTASEECERIKFYGKLPYRETLALENACDIMIAIYDPAIPNHKYAAPNKFYEALLLGKPILMAKNTGHDEVIEGNKIGVLIDYSKEGVAEGLNTLYNQMEMWPDMAVRMKDLYEKEFSWKEMERRLLGIYAFLENEKNPDRQ